LLAVILLCLQDGGIPLIINADKQHGCREADMEHCDYLNGTDWQLHYDESVFPPSTDSFLLSSFPVLRSGMRVCDLGAGSHLLGLLLLRRERELDVTGIERSPAACRLAERNSTENGLTDRLHTLCADLRDHASLPDAGRFDLVVCNPPYFPEGRGHPAGTQTRRDAREESACTLQDVCAAAARLLRWGGRLCLVHRAERLTDLLCAMRSAGIEPKRLRCVLTVSTAKAPSLLLLEGRLGGGLGLRWEPPLVMQLPDGTPSPELNAIYYRTMEGS
jgi:tRNA1Val (adenine37-N6)-methyltransferase